MKNQILVLFTLLFLLSACSQKKPDAHPKHPNYNIIKPKVKYKPNKKSLGMMVQKLQGSPYVWAEEGPNNFDCSGFTYYLYGSMGIDIPRVAREQAKVGKRISVKDLQYGDLIFFATSKNRRKITHVGMYLGEGWFTHASTVKNEVIYSNLLNSTYYKKRLRICRRYLPEKSYKYAKTSHTPWKIKSVSPKSTHIKENHLYLVFQDFEDKIEDIYKVIKVFPTKASIEISSPNTVFITSGPVINIFDTFSTTKT